MCISPESEAMGECEPCLTVSGLSYLAVISWRPALFWRGNNWGVNLGERENEGHQVSNFGSHG